MNNTHFHEIYIATSAFVIVAGLMGLSMETQKHQDWIEVSERNNVYNSNFSVQTRLDHDLPIEGTDFQ